MKTVAIIFIGIMCIVLAISEVMLMGRIDKLEQRMTQTADAETLKTVVYPLETKWVQFRFIGFEQDFIADETLSFISPDLKDTTWITNDSTILIDVNGDTLAVWYGDSLIYKKETQ